MQRSLFLVRYCSDSLMYSVFPGFVLRELCLVELCNKDWELRLGWSNAHTKTLSPSKAALSLPTNQQHFFFLFSVGCEWSFIDTSLFLLTGRVFLRIIQHRQGVWTSTGLIHNSLNQQVSKCFPFITPEYLQGEVQCKKCKPPKKMLTAVDKLFRWPLGLQVEQGWPDSKSHIRTDISVESFQSKCWDERSVSSVNFVFLFKRLSSTNDICATLNLLLYHIIYYHSSDFINSHAIKPLISKYTHCFLRFWICAKSGKSEV